MSSNTPLCVQQFTLVVPDATACQIKALWGLSLPDCTQRSTHQTAQVRLAACWVNSLHVQQWGDTSQNLCVKTPNIWTTQREVSRDTHATRDDQHDEFVAAASHHVEQNNWKLGLYFRLFFCCYVCSFHQKINDIGSKRAPPCVPTQVLPQQLSLTHQSWCPLLSPTDWAKTEET